MTPEMLIALAGLAAAGAGAYAAIRADLARLHARSEDAHKRIDWLQEKVFE